MLTSPATGPVFVATSTLPRTPIVEVETLCPMPGHRFHVGFGDSPDRLQSDELRYHVYVEAAGIYVLIED